MRCRTNKSERVGVSTTVPLNVLSAIDREAERLERSRSWVISKILAGDLKLPINTETATVAR